MDDRTMLELAAKSYFGDAPKHIGEGVLDWVSDIKGKWNPLEDDGDALRLAVYLFLEIDICATGIAVRTPCGLKVLVDESETQYIHVATRRAITRAAAEIQLNKERGK